MENIHLNLGWKCNNNCISCPEFRDTTRREVDLQHVLSKLKRMENIKKIFITGGEPTIHKYFSNILEFIRNKNPKIKIVLLCNGRTFSYEKYCENIKKYKIDRYIISLYGIDPTSHNLVTRSDNSFEQTIKGINNLIKKNKIDVSIPISKINYKSFDRYNEKFLENFSKYPLFRFRLVNLLGYAENNREELNIKFTEMWENLEPLLDTLVKNKIKFYLDNMMPFCLIPKRYHTYIFKQKKQHLINFNNPKEEAIQSSCQLFQYIEKCTPCKFVKKCNGIYINYIKYNGTGEFE